MKSAVVFTLAMGAAAMHIPRVNQNDNRQTPIVAMTEEDAVMNTPHEQTQMPPGQGFGMESNDDKIDVHVHLDISHRGPNTMVSHDTPSSPGNAMDATGANRNNGSPSGMRTMSESANRVGMPGGSSMSSDTGSNMMPAGSPMSSDTGKNMMPGSSSTSNNQQANEMPGAGGMDGSGATSKGMRTMGSDTGMYGHEVCKELDPDVPVFSQCRIPAYLKLGGETDLCCYWSDSEGAGNAGSGSGMMMPGKKANFDL